MIDGALYPTGPVKDKSWKRVINDKAKIDLPKSSFANPGVEFPKALADIMMSPTPASDARESEPTDVAPQSNDVMSQMGKMGRSQVFMTIMRWQQMSQKQICLKLPSKVRTAY